MTKNKHVPNLSIYLPELAVMRRLAAHHGCVLVSSQRKGDGSVRLMMERIVHGDIATIDAADIADPYQMARELEALADNASPELALFLRRCARSMRIVGRLRSGSF